MFTSNHSIHGMEKAPLQVSQIPNLNPEGPPVTFIKFGSFEMGGEYTLFFSSLDAVIDWTDAVQLRAERAVEIATARMMETLDAQLEQDETEVEA